MRCIAILAPGNTDVLRYMERPAPVPGENEVLIKVAAAGVNRADVLQRKGLYPPPPEASDLPGLEVAGIVQETGANVKRWKVGDKICALISGGGYAEFALAHEALCAPIPASLSMIEAAALPEGLFTVWNNVFVRGKLRPSENLLIHGGTSGIGTLAIQMGKQFGANVYATTSTLDKKRHCVRLGVTAAISRMNEDYVKILKDLVPAGIDVVLDMGGGDMINRDFYIMAQDGRHVTIAHHEGKTASIDIPTMMKKRLIVTGSTLRGRPIQELAALAHDIEKHVWPLIAAGKIKPVIDETFPLERAADAHKFMETGRHIGKIVLTL